MMISAPLHTYHADGSVPTTPNTVWVFGSNLAGRHGKGAAKVALQRFGARYGEGAGLVGCSYGIPTKDANLNVLPLVSVRAGVEQFLVHALAHPETMYFVTRVGCGLAGFKDATIAPLFRAAPANCDLPKNWRPWFAQAVSSAPSAPSAQPPAARDPWTLD